MMDKVLRVFKDLKEGREHKEDREHKEIKEFRVYLDLDHKVFRVY
jgi:hypothetical protein